MQDQSVVIGVRPDHDRVRRERTRNLRQRAASEVVRVAIARLERVRLKGTAASAAEQRLSEDLAAHDQHPARTLPSSCPTSASQLNLKTAVLVDSK